MSRIILSVVAVLVVAVVAFIFRADIKKAIIKTHQFINRKKIERAEVASRIFNNKFDRQLVKGYVAKRTFTYGKKVA